jgi:hypothetical protein
MGNATGTLGRPNLFADVVQGSRATPAAIRTNTAPLGMVSRHY